MDKRKVVSEAKLKALEKARAVRAANLKAKKEGKTVPATKKRKPADTERVYNKRGKLVNEKRMKAGAKNITKRVDRMRKDKDKISEEFDDVIARSLKDLEGLKIPKSDEPVKISMREGVIKNNNKKGRSSKESKESNQLIRKQESKEVDNFILEQISEMSDRSSSLVGCIVDLQKKNFDKSRKLTCFIYILDALTTVKDIIQNIDNFSEYAHLANDDAKELYKDSIIELMNQCTSFLSLLLNTY